VRAVAVDPSNDFSVTGADRMLKFWDLATGHLRVTLTGHIVRRTSSAAAMRSRSSAGI
jgi:pleiotropic regulator 1